MLCAILEKKMQLLGCESNFGRVCESRRCFSQIMHGSVQSNNPVVYGPQRLTIIFHCKLCRQLVLDRGNCMCRRGWFQPMCNFDLVSNDGNQGLHQNSAVDSRLQTKLHGRRRVWKCDKSTQQDLVDSMQHDVPS